MEDPLDVSPSKGNQRTTRSNEKNYFCGNQTTTSGLNLPLLWRLSYGVGQRKSGATKMMDRGEEKVRVQMNVVPLGTINTSGRTEN